ncbi:MFS transporter [Polymorphobacter megasporae]|uniref:MFS transporter n=1 Tax=Glacieibacterium megasporae TaxID=2835787 RepID=UPI001C1E5F29|nr:MFS transporter [Polymorphobacter megasporae]UAJ11094.1 MFS transporter [Polymorphobacter megasporae]
MEFSADTAAPDRRQPGIAQGMTVIAAGFLPILAIVTLFPAVPSIIDHFAADPEASWKVPAMVSAPGLAIAAIAPFAGILVDRFGRRKLLLFSTFFYALIGVIPFFLNNLNAIYGSRILLGATEAAILTTLNTLIGDYWDAGGRRRWLALQGSIGPLLAAAMIYFAGMLTAVRWNGVFLIYLVALPIFGAMVFYLYEPASDATARKMLGIDSANGAVARSPFSWSGVVQIGAVTLAAAILYYVFIVNGGVAFREVGVQSSAELGKITALPSLFIIAGAGLFWLMGRSRQQLQIATCFGLLGTGLMIIGLAPNWKWMVAGLIVQQTGAGMTIPTLIAWAQTKLPFEHRGRGMGVWTACFFFGQFASPLLVSIVHGVAGTMQAAFLAAGILGLIGAVVGIAMAVSRKSPHLTEA